MRFVYVRDEYSRDDFILRVLQGKGVDVENTEYEVVSDGNEGFNLTSDNGKDIDDQHYTTLAELIFAIGSIYDDASYMSVEDIRDALITKEDECDRPMLASLWATIGYINCGLNLGYDFLDEEIAQYRQQLRDI